MGRIRKIDRKIHNVSDYDSVRAFLSRPAIAQGFHIITENGIPIDLLCQNRGSDTTVVFLHAAITKDYTLPVLTGLSVSKDTTVNRVFLSDASLALDDSLNLAWFAGSHSQRLQQLLQDVVAHIVQAWGSQRLVFFGSSGGGFASMYFSAQFPGSLAIVANPQTNLAKYEPAPVSRFAEVCFGVTGADPLDRIPHSIVTDLTKLYSNPLSNTVAYMQNSGDVSHVNDHLQPLLDSIHPDNDLYLLQDHWGEGHVAPPKQLFTDTLDASAADSWIDSLKNLGFKSVTGQE